MREVLVVRVARRGSGAVEEMADLYRGRIGRYVCLSEIRVRPEAGRDDDPARARVKEGERILQHLREKDTLVALDERGTERTTEELAAWLAERLDAGRVVFAIGSDLGLAPEVTRGAGQVLALSRFTLAHELARVVLLEQLYRCFDMLAGGRYHRGGDPSFGYNQPGRRRR